MREKAIRLHAPRVERVNLKHVLLAANGLCGICKNSLDCGVSEIDFDHVVPLARGGTHTNDNLQATHASCNRAKRAG